MAFAIQQLPEQPTAIITVDVPLACHSDSLRSVIAQMCAIAREYQQMACIIDLDGLDLSYSDILLCLDEFKATQSENYAQILPVVAGSHPLIAVGIKKIEEQLGITIKQYDTLELACAAVHSA